MKKQFATFLIGFFLIQSTLHSLNLELNTSYDNFRGMPDGSWNGNQGAFLSANLGTCLYEGLGLQIGGSYGLYNWEGRDNVVFKNSKKLEQQAFTTVGLFSSFGQFNAGIVYDRLYTNHFGIYDLNPTIDQLRFQTGFQLCSDELGVWGTLDLSREHQRARGVPISFKAISQMNIFWTHLYENCAKTTLWIGSTYRNSLRYHHKTPGIVVAGFSFRVPLTGCLFIDGHGAYMSARKSSGTHQSRNYGSNLCLGVTYLFGNTCCNYGSTYMPIANNANFFIDTNINQ